MSQSRRTYDQEYVVALRQIADIIPQNETLAATEIYPQVAYFTDHNVKVPWVRSERALVQFMWKNNCSYLLVPEYTSAPKPDNTPLLIQLAEKPFEKISDFYAKYISVPKPEPDNTPTPLLNTSSVPQPDNNNSRLDIRKSIKEDVVFQKLFEKILDYPTENSLLHLYQLRSNITRDNLSIVTDKTRPIVSVSLPINGTIMESEFGVLRVNVTGSAEDADSNIRKVEISIDGSPYQLTTPRAPGDWSTWSFSDFVTEGTKRIMVRATDNADKRVWVPIFITIK
ncbi:MAG TPA: Ig-like domain-containing protein [Nitrososphaera sp.]